MAWDYLENYRKLLKNSRNFNLATLIWIRGHKGSEKISYAKSEKELERESQSKRFLIPKREPQLSYFDYVEQTFFWKIWQNLKLSCKFRTLCCLLGFLL